MLDLQISDLTFFEDAEQTADIYRFNAVSGERAEVATSVKMILRQLRQRQLILPTGEIVEQPDYNAYLFEPNTAIEIGDILVRPNENDLFVESDPYHPEGTSIMILDLTQERK